MQRFPDGVVFAILECVPRKKKDWLHCKLVSKQFEKQSYRVFKPQQDDQVALAHFCIVWGDLKMSDLYWAISMGNIDSVKFLLVHPDSEVPSPSFIPLAITSNHMGIFQELWKHSDINCEICNPLLASVIYDKPLFGLEIIKDPRVTVTDSNKDILEMISKKSCLTQSNMYDIPDMRSLAYELVKSRKFDPTTKTNNLLIRSIEREDTGMFELLIKDDRIDPSMPDNIPLQTAIKLRQTSMVEELVKDQRVVDHLKDISFASMIESKNKTILDNIFKIYSLPTILALACGYENIELDFVSKLLYDPSFDAEKFAYEDILSVMDNDRRDIMKLFLADNRLDVCNDSNNIQYALYHGYSHFYEMFFNHPSFRPETITPKMIKKLWNNDKVESIEAIVLNGKINLKENSLNIIDLFSSPGGTIEPYVSPDFVIALFTHPLLSIGKQVNRFLRYFMKTKDTLHINMCLSMPHVKPFSVACKLVEWILDQECDDEMAQILVGIAEDYPNYCKEIAQSVKENERWMHYLSLYPRMEELLIADYGSIAPEDSMTQLTLNDFVTVTTRKRQRTMDEFVTCKRVKK